MAKTATHITVDGERYDLQDAKLAQDVSDLKSAVAHDNTNISKGVITLPGSFVVGAVYQSTGLPRYDIKYRIMTPELVTVDQAHAATYRIQSGYMTRWWVFVNGELSGGTHESKSTVELFEGNTYRFEILKTPEDASYVVSDIYDMLNSVTAKSILLQKVEEKVSAPVSYSEIADNPPNLADGTYTANGGSTLSGNTVTVTAAYQGIISNEIVPASSKIRVKVKATFNVPRCILRLQYYTSSWQTTATLQELDSNTQSDVVVDLAQYAGSKYRILLQNTSITSDVTNTITVDSLEINNVYAAEESQYYDSNFEEMLLKIFAGIDRDKIYTCLKDGTGDFNSFVTAVQTLSELDGAHLFVGAGEWDIISEFGSAYMANVSSSASTWGLVLKNNIHIVGSSRSVIKAINASGSTNFDNIKQYFSVFNAGAKGFTIENLTIVDDGLRYTVHDDLGIAGPTPYHNRYINCSMAHTNGMYPDCIGAGIGEDAYVEIRGCIFDGDETRNGQPATRYVYYHGNNNSSVTNAKARIYVTDNYFCKHGTFKLNNYGNSLAPSGVVYVSNNSFGSTPEITDGSSPNPIIKNMSMIAWNNEISQ